ncbi:MAG: esterase family protein [Clostridia bacterium]|nr:esterase family protein [Clostridia bacterium]
MALLHVDFFSDALGMCAEMDVILPENTKGLIGMGGKEGNGKYPTLYLLHGMSDDHTIWQRRTSIERYVSDLGLAVVMPSTHLGWYTDMYRGHKWWTYISQELPQICRSFFPNMSDRREDTFAAGLSMGGYGALKCGLCAPETFSKVASLSGGVDAAGIVENLPRSDGSTLWEDIFGPADQVRGSFNDLFAQAEKCVLKPKVYMWCGTEDFLYKSNIAMRDHLTKLGYDLTFEQSPGDHQWKYWDKKIQTVLKWLDLGNEEA